MLRLIIFICILLPISLFSLVFSPNSYTFLSEKNQITARFVVTNNSNQILPIEFYIVDRKISEKGEPSYGEAPKDDFVIFPEQMLLEPNKKQSIQVSWVANDIDMDIEQTYTLMAEVLPVPTASDGGNNQTSLNLSVRYASMLYVKPSQAKAQITAGAEYLEVEGENGPENILLLTVTNTGNAHARLNEPKLQLKLKDEPNFKPILLNTKSLPNVDRTIVLAKSKREYKLAWPEPLPKDALETKLSFKKEP